MLRRVLGKVARAGAAAHPMALGFQARFASINGAFFWLLLRLFSP